LDNYTFRAGVDPGGLTDHSRIKILICHLLSNLEHPIHHSDLMEAITGRGQANYFECANALVELVSAKFIHQDASGEYYPLPLGRQISDELGESDLPLTVREKVMTYARELMNMRINKRTHTVEFKERETGCLTRCAVSDSAGDEIFALELHTPQRLNKAHIRDNFAAKAEELMRHCIAELTDEPL